MQVEIKPQQPLIIQSTSPQQVVPHNPRSPIEKKDYGLYINAPEKPLLKRLCICSPELVFYILSTNDLTTLLHFRLIAKDFNYFASTTNMDFSCNPLIDRATISFHYNQICPIFIDQSLKEKWDLAPKDMELQIIVSLAADLLNLESTLAFNNPFKITFQPENINELNSLETIISIQDQVNFLYNLKKLDFSKLFINIDNINFFNTILTTISNNLNFLSNLKKITFGEICPTVTPVVPDSLNNFISIITKQDGEQSWWTLENMTKGAIFGLGLYSAYRYCFPKESEDKKKNQ